MMWWKGKPAIKYSSEFCRNSFRVGQNLEAIALQQDTIAPINATIAIKWVLTDEIVV